MIPTNLVNSFFSIFPYLSRFFYSCLAIFWAFLLGLFLYSTGLGFVDIKIITFMLEQIKKYEEQLQEISREMSIGLINKSEMLLKALEKEVRACF